MIIGDLLGASNTNELAQILPLHLAPGCHLCLPSPEQQVRENVWQNSELGSQKSEVRLIFALLPPGLKLVGLLLMLVVFYPSWLLAWLIELLALLRSDLNCNSPWCRIPVENFRQWSRLIKQWLEFSPFNSLSLFLSPPLYLAPSLRLKLRVEREKYLRSLN